MAGITDAAFRTLARDFHDCLIYTEMVSSEALCRGNPKTLIFCQIDESHHPVALQLVGHDPERMAEAAGKAEELGADMIDINAGCPDKAIVNSGAGGGLLSRPKLLADIVHAVTRAVDVPVSVKMRLGPDRDISLELARVIEGAGADMLALHGRTLKRGLRDPSDREAIKKVVRLLDIPVLANGDVRSEADAVDLLGHTGAAGVMIGRATRGRPYLPGTACSLLDGNSFQRPEGRELGHIILRHARLEEELFGKSMGMKRMRKHVHWYLEAAGAAFDAKGVFSLTCLSELEGFLNEVLPDEPLSP